MVYDDSYTYPCPSFVVDDFGFQWDALYHDDFNSDTGWDWLENQPEH